MLSLGNLLFFLPAVPLLVILRGPGFLVVGKAALPPEPGLGRDF